MFGLGWLLAATLHAPSSTRLDVWPWAALASLGWLGFAGAGMMLSLRADTARLNPWVGFGAALYAVVVVTSAWLSPWQGGSLAAALPTLGVLGLLATLAAGLQREPYAESVRLALDLAAGALVLVGLGHGIVQLLGAPSLAALLGSRNPAPFGHSVTTAGAALLALSWLTAGAVRGGEGRRWRALGAAGAALLLFSTASRAGVAALGLGCVLALGTWWWRRGRQLRDAALAMVVGLAVLAVAVASNERLRDLVVRGEWNAVSSESNRQRLAMAEAGLAIGQSNGVFGPGPGTLSLTYHAGNARMPFAPDGALQVHSAPLQVWATTGPAGVLALLVFLGALIPSAVRSLSPRTSPDEAVLGAGLLAYAAFALTDHQLDQPFIAAFACAHLVRLPGVTVPGNAATHRLRGVALAGLAVAMLAGPVWYRGRDVAARAAFTAAARAHDAGERDAVQAGLATASARAPWDRFYLEAAAAWRWETDPAGAAALLRRARAIAPAWPPEFSTYNLAWLAIGLGETAEAVSLFDEAARLAPQRSGVFLGHAFALAAAGDQAAANQRLARHVLADPRSITTAFWDDPAMRARWPAIKSEVQTLASRLAPRVADDALRARLQSQVALILAWAEPSAATFEAALTDQPEAIRTALRALITAPPAGQGPWPGAEAWGELGRVWAAGRPAEGAPDAWRQALILRLAASPDFLTFVTARPSDPALRRGYRVSRGGHRIVQRHPDSPDLFDFPAFEDNLLLAPVIDRIFAARGWLPGSVWSALASADGTP